MSFRWICALFAVALATPANEVLAQFRLDINKLADGVVTEGETIQLPAFEPARVNGVRVLRARGVKINQNIERWMFREHGTEEATRERLHERLNLAIKSIDENTELTFEQKERLRLAGMGDIALYVAEYDKLRAEYGNQQDPNAINGLLKRIQPLQKKLQVTLFGPGSIFSRVANRILEGEQKTKLEKADEQRLRYYYRALLKSTVSKTERVEPLKAIQREQIMELMDEMPLPVRADRKMAYWFAMYSFAKAKPKLQEILNDRQLAAMQPLMDRGAGMEPALRRAGYLE